MTKLPVLLAGATWPPDFPLAPLAEPLYCLSAPGAHGLYSALPVGDQAHLAWLEQWLQSLTDMPEHPAFAMLKAGMALPQDHEESWHSLRGLLENKLDQAPAKLSNAVLRFLLLAHLDRLEQSEWQVYRQYQKAQQALDLALDRPFNAEPGLLTPPVYAPPLTTRLQIWGQAAADLELPPALWAMPQTWFSAWRQMWGSPAPRELISLDWPASWLAPNLHQARQVLRAWLQAGAIPSENDLAIWRAASRGAPRVGQARLYWLPAAALKTLLLKDAGQLACLVWDD